MYSFTTVQNRHLVSKWLLETYKMQLSDSFVITFYCFLTSSKVLGPGKCCLDPLTDFHLEQLRFCTVSLSGRNLNWNSPGASKLPLTCSRDSIFHLYELSTLVTITLPPMCIIVVWTSFQKMEVNVKHVATSADSRSDLSKIYTYISIATCLQVFFTVKENKKK